MRSHAPPDLVEADWGFLGWLHPRHRQAGVRPAGPALLGQHRQASMPITFGVTGINRWESYVVFATQQRGGDSAVNAPPGYPAASAGCVPPGRARHPAASAGHGGQLAAIAALGAGRDPAGVAHALPDAGRGRRRRGRAPGWLLAGRVQQRSKWDDDAARVVGRGLG